jgi:hypothetical protein
MKKWEDPGFKLHLITDISNLCGSLYEAIRKENCIKMPPTPPKSPSLKLLELPRPNNEIDCFTDLSDFLRNAMYKTNLNSSCLVLTAYYMALLTSPRTKGLKEADALDKLTNFSALHILLACLIAANKFIEDTAYSNATWATLTGLTLSAVNGLEQCLLCALGHKLEVGRSVFKKLVVIMAKEFDWMSVPTSTTANVIAPKPVVAVSEMSLFNKFYIHPPR